MGCCVLLCRVFRVGGDKFVGQAVFKPIKSILRVGHPLVNVRQIFFPRDS